MTQMLIDLALGNMCFQHKIDVKPRAEFMSTHAHNVYELIYVINGDLTHTVEDKKYKLYSGDLVLIRPNTYHLIRIDSSEKDYERINIQFGAEDIQADMSIIPDTVNVINTTNHTRISGILSKLDTYAETYEREVFFKMLGGLLTEIVYNISLVDSIETRQETEASNHVIAQAVAYINKNLYTSEINAYTAKQAWEAWKSGRLTVGQLATWQERHGVYFDAYGRQVAPV